METQFSDQTQPIKSWYSIWFDFRSLRYIVELQKFVEDNQWKRSLAIEPNQLKADIQDPKDHPEVMGPYNLSPSKTAMSKGPDGPGVGVVPRPFVPGHRRAKSDGCGMFLMSSKKHEIVQDNYKANYSHHLLDDSKLDEEPSRPTSPNTLPADLRSSLRKGTLEKCIDPGGVMKILRNPGIKCQHQVKILSFIFTDRVNIKKPIFWRPAFP